MVFREEANNELRKLESVFIDSVAMNVFVNSDGRSTDNSIFTHEFNNMDLFGGDFNEQRTNNIGEG